MTSHLARRRFETVRGDGIGAQIREWIGTGKLRLDEPDELAELDALLGLSAWLASAFAAYEGPDEVRPLESCLGVPTRSALARARRNHYVRQAAELLGGGSALEQAKRLHAELAVFMRCTWRAWRDRDDAPDDASEIRRTLFHLAKAMRGRPTLCVKQLQNILALEISRQ